MNFQRIQGIEPVLKQGRALVVYGPRRIGKTTMVTAYAKKAGEEGRKVKYDVGDDIRLQTLFNAQKRAEILDYVQPYDVVVIDEAQNIEQIGIAAKMIVDAFPEKTLILTGSSSFDIAHKVGEPLTGRHFTLTLLPFSQSEIQGSEYEKHGALEKFLIYGSYPEVLATEGSTEKKRILRELVSSYLFKDILALDRIRHPEILLQITKCLAFQIGNEVSIHEIARTVHTDDKTVQRYLDLLQKTFIIKRVGGYSRNLRNEISKKAKWYFYDLGVRNAVIEQWNELHNRNDVGNLFENFVAMELIRSSNILDRPEELYFWRTHQGQEVDFIIEREGKIFAMESKWSGKPAKGLQQFTAVYPDAIPSIITKENYLEILKEHAK